MGFSPTGPARLLLLVALAAAARGAAAAEPAAAASCADLADTPLDPNVTSWTFTLYVPPAVVPALLDPSAPGAAAAAEAFIPEIDSPITPNFTAWFGSVGVFEEAWILGEEPNPGKQLVPDSIRIRTMNITGPFFNPQAIPEMGGGSGGSGGGSSSGGGGALPMGPTVQIYDPREGLYDRMTHAAGGWNQWTPEDGELMQTQVLWCDKSGALISLLSNSTEPVEVLGDIGLLSVAMRPVLMLLGASNSSALDDPIEYQSVWVRRTYWPLEYKGQQTGYLILNVDFESQEDAIAGTNAGKAELIMLAHPPLPDDDYVEELRAFALALQGELSKADGSN